MARRLPKLPMAEIIVRPWTKNTRPCKDCGRSITIYQKADESGWVPIVADTVPVRTSHDEDRQLLEHYAASDRHYCTGRR